MKTQRHVTGILVLAATMASSAGGSHGSLTYQGRIKNSLGEALETSGVRFEFTIQLPPKTLEPLPEIWSSWMEPEKSQQP